MKAPATLSFSTVPDARRKLLRSTFCGACGKLSLRNEEDARSYIGLLLRSGMRLRGWFALHPYRCPNKKGWHVGRDRKILNLDFRLGRAERFLPAVQTGASHV